MEQQLIREIKFVRELTAIFLAVASGFAGVAFLSLRFKVGGIPYFWLLAALVFAMLSLDALLDFMD